MIIRAGFQSLEFLHRIHKRQSGQRYLCPNLRQDFLAFFAIVRQTLVCRQLVSDETITS